MPILWGVPPSPRAIGIMELGRKSSQNIGFKGLTGRNKELARLPGQFDASSLVPTTGNQSLTGGLFCASHPFVPKILKEMEFFARRRVSGPKMRATETMTDYGSD